jgi:hypothetical protein
MHDTEFRAQPGGVRPGGRAKVIYERAQTDAGGRELGHRLERLVLALRYLLDE